MKRVLLVLVFAPALFAQTVLVDATDARRGIFHTHLTIPIAQRPVTLVYPKWVPGEHAPSGPLMQMAGLHIRGGGNELTWHRDPVDPFAFHIDAPANVASVDVDFDYMSPSSTFGFGYGESSNATQNLALILFNHVVMYPAGVPTDKLTYTPSIRIPNGWKYDTSLKTRAQNGDRIDFEPLSLTMLIDSPVVAGSYTRTVPLADNGRERVFITADSSPALALSNARAAQLTRLVAEADALFGARHYRQYVWLVTLSDLIEPQGLEHHESTDIRAVERGLVDEDWAARTLSTLSHEFVHSWNGKYRRPAGLATPDYQTPMQDELLFVYEGGTRYMGDFVLKGRSGIATPEENREFAAYVAATLDRDRVGRSWRPLVDTAVGVPVVGTAPNEGVPYRRSLDYYDEMLFVWLDADMIIRTKSGGTKSFDDFAKLFWGGTNTAPMVKPYTLDDVVAALNSIVSYDWKGFFDQRVYRIAEHPPLGALEAAGWRLVYNTTPNSYLALRERTGKETNASFSLGMWVKNEGGKISDVVYGGPAYQAGLTPGMTILAVNGRKYDSDVLREELRAAKPLDVIVQQGSFSGTFHIDYRGGELFPHLERIANVPDTLDEIIKPHAR
jgi:predicted metalloprotease with PDZ domain